jgi:hypothetical protein
MLPEMRLPSDIVPGYLEFVHIFEVHEIQQFQMHGK